jgi:hypothetical protein
VTPMNKTNGLFLFAFAAAVLCPPAFSQTAFKDLKTVSPSALQAGGFGPVERPVPPGTGRSLEILLYETEEEWPFESRARAAMEQRLQALQRAGIKTLGGRAVRNPNHRWSFVIEYFPAIEDGGKLPAAVIVQSYTPASTYWRKQDAETALSEASTRLRQAGIHLLGGEVVDAGRDNAFTIHYLMPNRLWRGRRERANIVRWQGGRFTFESRAEAAMGEYASRFQRAGVGVIRTRAVQMPDRDWAVEVEYVNRSNEYGDKPAFQIARYDAKDTFPFDHRALAAAKALLPSFSVQGAAPLHGFARKAGRDWSFSVDYLVKNLYGRYGRVRPAVTVQTYFAAEAFTFESEAERALEAKKAAFRQAGIGVLGGRAVRSGRDWSYELDYFEPASQDERPPRREYPRGNSRRRI